MKGGVPLFLVRQRFGLKPAPGHLSDLPMHARRLPLSPAAQRRPTRRPGMRAFSAGVAQLAEHLFCKQVVGGSSPPASSILFAKRPGGLPERPKGAGCKPAGIAYVGSNPTPSTVFFVEVGAGGDVERRFRLATSVRRPRRFVVPLSASVADVDQFFQDFRGRLGEACASQTTEVIGAPSAVNVAKRPGTAAGRSEREPSAGTHEHQLAAAGRSEREPYAETCGNLAGASRWSRGASLAGSTRESWQTRSTSATDAVRGTTNRRSRRDLVEGRKGRQAVAVGQLAKQQKPLNASTAIALTTNLDHNSRPSQQAGVAQLVEHQPSKLNVEGSNPFSRSTASLAATRIGWPT